MRYSLFKRYCYYMFQLIPLYTMDLVGHLEGLPGLVISCVFSGSLRFVNIYLTKLNQIIIDYHANVYVYPPNKTPMTSGGGNLFTSPHPSLRPSVWITHHPNKGIYRHFRVVRFFSHLSKIEFTCTAARDIL